MPEQIQKQQIESPDNHETDQSPTHYGISFDSFDETVWRDVLAIYIHDVKGIQLDPDDDIFYMFPVEKALPGTGLRLGSRFSMHSKLEIQSIRQPSDDTQLIGFNFYLNDGGLPPKQLEEAQTMAEKFKSDIDEYLLFTGNATPIE